MPKKPKQAPKDYYDMKDPTHTHPHSPTHPCRI